MAERGDDEIYEVRCGTGGCLRVAAVLAALVAALLGAVGWLALHPPTAGRTRTTVPLCSDREKLGFSANAPCETGSGEIIND